MAGKRWLIISVFLLGMGCTAAAQTIYVDADATGANDGSSWNDAYNYLQDALAIALSGDEIWVAQGTYKPDANSADPNGSGDRTATFQLVNGVAIRGGYASFGEPDPNARDIELYETILSGDLYGDDIDVNDPCDLWDEPTRAENSYHVLTAIRKDAVLDGFTITGGNANGSDPWPHRNGSGGGIYIDTRSGKSPKLSNCTFKGNSSVHYGGGICYTGVELGGKTLANCTFIKNWAGAGGGIYDDSSISPSRTLILTNCRFIRNSAVKGGGICVVDSRPILTNCMFIGNSAEFGGASAHYDSAIATYNKCTFNANSASYGKALFCSCWYTRLKNVVRLNNCIIWDGGQEIYNNNNSSIAIIYSDVQGSQSSIYDPCEGLVWGDGNIDVDPCFADANNVDYHLKSEAGRWDANEGRWTKDDVTSPCIDGGDMASPIGYEPFPNGGLINMGAYGGTTEASKSYFGEPVCETIVAGDINGDCIVNFKDLAFMAFHWLEDRGAANSKTIIEDGIEHYVKTDKSVYELGEHTEILYRTTNLGDEVWVVSGMGNVRDIRVEVKEGGSFRQVWSFSLENPTPPGPGGLVLQPGQSAELRVPWPQFNMNWTVNCWDYTQAPPGTYRITGVLDGYRMLPEPPMEIHSSVSVDITVEY